MPRFIGLSWSILKADALGLLPGRIVAAMLLLPLFATNSSAQDDGYEFGIKPAHTERAKAEYKANLERFKDDENVLVLPGLVAKREEKRVEIMAEATGVPGGEIVEFLFVAQNSDHGYESLMWSHAKPSDVHKALVFIGVPAGKSFNPGELRFWPKGERVILSVSPAGKPESVRIENLLLDKNTNQALPEDGFVFTGSFPMPPRGNLKGGEYAADVIGAKSIASMYTDPSATLDVPRQAWQSEVYGTLVVNPECDFSEHDLLTVVIEPEYKDGRRRVMDLKLRVRRPEDGNVMVGAPELSHPRFVLTDSEGKALTEKPGLAEALVVFETLVRKGHDAFVSVSFDADMPLEEVRSICRVFAMIDVDRGIRIEPPEAGQIYYKTFLPDARMLNQRGRMSKPLELRLVGNEGAVTGTLTEYTSVFVMGEGRGEPKETTFDVPTPDSLLDELAAVAERLKRPGRRARTPTITIFADGDLTYGQLAGFLAPILPTHNAIHVFLDIGLR